MYAVAEKKINSNIFQFLQDQRENRDYTFADIDDFEGFSEDSERDEQPPSKKIRITDGIDEDLSSFEPNDSEDEDYICDATTETDSEDETRRQTRVNLPSFARACDRRFVSDRAAADLASSLLHDLNEYYDLGLSESELIVDKSKVRREREKSRNQPNKTFDLDKIWGLCFDGRRDNTSTQSQDEETGTYHRRVVREEHITLIKEAGSVFIGFIPTIGEDARTIADSIFANLQSIEAPLNNSKAIGSDGTNVNTGHEGGIIRLFEQLIGSPLQWLICLLHFNEIPLKHLIKTLYGVAKGPNSFCGSLTKSLETCSDLPIVDFEAITTDFPDIDFKDLSTDQKYLWDISTAISTGKCSKALAIKQPGVMTLSRWLNTASRFLRLYVSTEKPSSNLKTVVTYIMKVYVPLWFKMKKEKYCIDGPKHLFWFIKATRFLSPKLLKEVNENIFTNGYFAHSENILLAMLADENQEYRKKAVNKILEIRKNKPSTNKQLRKFVVPKIRLDASNYTEMIDWKSKFTEPPVTKHLSDKELRNFIVNHSKDNEVFRFLCHNQAVETHVK